MFSIVPFCSVKYKNVGLRNNICTARFRAQFKRMLFENQKQYLFCRKNIQSTLIGPWSLIFLWDDCFELGFGQ